MERASILFSSSIRVLAGLLLARTVSTLHATDGTWTANNNNAVWSNNTSGYWSNNIVANGIDATATFSPILTLNKYMYLDSHRTIGNITWSGQKFSYEIRPNSTPGKILTLQVSSGTPTISCTPSQSFIISATIAGTQGFSKTGGGPLTLSGASTYSGNTTISAGTISLTGSLTGGTAISTSANGILNQSAAGVISGAASFTQGSSGTSILAGANTYSGTTKVEAGTLTLGANNTLPASSPVVLAGGKLDMGGFTNAAATLAVTGNTTLALGAGSLSFAASPAVAWTGNLTLTGTLGATSLRFGTGPSGLTSAQLARILFNGIPVSLDANGYLGSAVKTIQVETAADGSGMVVPAQSLSAGQSITVYAIARDVNGVFIANVPASWGLTDVTGFVEAGDLKPAADGKSATFTVGGYGTAKIVASGSVPVLVPSGTITVNSAPVVSGSRPFIWVRASEHAAIVAKINTQPWAKSVYNALVARGVSPVTSHQADRDAYLRQLPVNWTATPPVIRTNTMRGEVAPRFTEALDCAVLYYITQDGKYARLAADLLHNAVKTIAPLPDDGLPGNDYLSPDGGQSRCVGTQLPIIYDLLHPYLQANQVYDVETATMVNFNFEDAQTVFRACYKDVWLNGNGNNHSGFHSHMVFNNMLALDDPAERDAAIQAFISSRQRNACSIAFVNDRIAEADDIWPECFNYTGVMNTGFTYHMILLERIDPSLKLFETYPAIPASFHRRSQFRYPNGDLMQHGHTHRNEGGLSYGMLEQAYAHALARGYTGQAQFWGGLIKNGTQTGEYNRSITQNDISGGAYSARKENLQLLLQAPTITETAAPLPEPRTDDLVYAGITMQRNPAPQDNKNYGLMGFVGGAGYTHGHASGMNMELYGMGLVMGRKGHAEDERSSDLHNNFDRIFGGANTIIVNGASMGYGGHAWLAINKVQNVAMEPQPFATALSTNHSFTVSSFLDDKGDMAEGTQQRMLSIVRTSPMSGFYVDIFRSKSTVTNRTAITLDGPVTNQYHDYIYRNIGETNITVQTAGGALPLSPQPARFQDTSAFTSRYKFPGTVHFTNTEVSHPTNQAFRTQFAATVSNLTRYMDMHMPAVATREIAKVDSPPFSDAPAPYHTKNAPTLVVRQIGDAWDKPFVAVYEPHFGAADGTIQNIETLEQGGLVVGVKVESLVQGTHIIQYVLSHPDGNGVISYPSLGIEFRGRFAVITDRDDHTGELYLGEGTLLEYGGYVVKSADGTTAQASVRFNAGGVVDIASNDSIIVSDAGSGRIVGPNAVAHNLFSMALTKSMFPPLPSSSGATFSKVSGPAWLGVAANGAVSGSPANANLGINTFTVKASNGIDPDVTTTLEITVLPDTTSPTALSFSPGNGAVAASVDANPRVTFSENVAFGTGTITLRRVSDDTVVESFDVANPPTGLTLSGATVTINPTADLDYITGYYLLIDATAIKDLSGNAFPGISGKTAWTFTTAIQPVFRTWTGASYAAYWSHAANWTPAGNPDGEGYHVIYHATGAARLTHFLHDNYTIGWMTFNDLADSAVTLRLYRNDDSARSLTMGGTYNRNPVITVDAGSAGNHIIGGNGTEIVTPGNLIIAGNLNVAHNGSGTLTINRPITQSGTRSVTKTGSGNLVLSGASTYTGATTVNGGKLQLAGGNNRLSTTMAMTLADVAGVVFDLNGQNQTLGSLAGGGTTGGNITLGAGLLTVGNATNTTYSGVISGMGGGLTKQGDGSLALTGANNYTGATTINGGALILGVSNAIPAASPLILGGGTLDVGNASTSLGMLAVTGSATLTLVDGAGTLSFADSSSASWTGSLTLLSQDGPLRQHRVRFGTSATALTTDQLARISLDGQRLTLDANGYLVAAVSSTYFWDNNGTTAGFGIAGGTWDEPTLGHWTLSPNGTGTPQASLNTSTSDGLNFGNGATGLSGGTIGIPDTVEAGSLTFASGSGQVTLDGGIIALGDEATITVANSTNTISSQLSGANTSLTKTGTGILILAGANTVYGATVIADGILELAHEDALLHSPLDTANSVAGQAAKGLRTNLITLKLGGLTGNKNLADVFTTTHGGYSGVTQITLNVALGKDLTYSGTIDGAKTLTKTGAGSQRLTGACVFGSTTLEDGTLAFGPNNVSLGTLTVTGNATLAPGSGSLTFADSSAIPWTGTLTITGTLGATTLRFGSSATALTAAQLASIKINGNSAALDVNGYLVQMATGTTGFTSWITGTFTNGSIPLAKQGPNNDADNDGISNLVEYAIAGEDPTVSKAAVGSFNGTTLSFTKRPGTVGLTYAIHESTDLGRGDDWTQVSGGSYVTTTTTISYSLPGGLSENFLRLQVLSN